MLAFYLNKKGFISIVSSDWIEFRSKWKSFNGLFQVDCILGSSYDHTTHVTYVNHDKIYKMSKLSH